MSILEVVRNTDRGASAVTIALMMVLFMGMAAVAVDLGLGFNERRLDQTGVDTGVMAGAVEIVTGGSFQDTVDEVLSYVNSNIRPVDPGDWVACEDPDQLFTTAADLNLTPSTECISFQGAERIRVRVPTQDVDTAFSQFIGFNSLSTSAAAEALGIQFPSAGNAPPFVALAGSAGGDLICLRTSPGGPTMPPLMTGNGQGDDPSLGGDPDPCDDTVYDPNSQFFGVLDPHVYYNNDTGEITCRKNLVEYMIAAGIDHTLSYFDPGFVVGTTNPTGPSVVEDDCNPVPVLGVNTIPLKTGLSAGELRCGMLTTNGGGCSNTVSPGPAGGSNVPARLHLGPNVQATHTFLGERMDNTPLWDYLSLGSGAPTSCVDLQSALGEPGWDYFDYKGMLLDCLDDWDEDGQILSDDIIETPRFAWIPFLAESNLTTEPSSCPSSASPRCVHFNDFIPVYIQTLYTQISGGGAAGGCDDEARHDVSGPNQRWGRHDAGEPIDCGRNNGNLDMLSAIVLECGMLSGDVCTNRPGVPGGDVIPRLELTK